MFIRKSHTEVGNSTTDISNHDTNDQQHRHIGYLLRKQKNKDGNNQRPQERCQNQNHGTGTCQILGKEDHGYTHHQLCTAGNAQHEGACNGVAEERLQQKAGNRQRTA